MRPLRRPDLASIKNFGNSIGDSAADVDSPNFKFTFENINRPFNQPVDSSEKGEKYEFARTWLILAFGNYCAYCEVPIEANLAIEHKLAKANPDFKDYVDDWTNLLLACTNCNSTKGNRQLWHVPDKINRTSKASLDYFPDRLVTFNLTDSPFTYTKQNGGDVVVNGTTDIATDMIQLVGLNEKSQDLKVSDRRVEGRNKAWELAVKAVERLHAFYLLTEDLKLRDTLHHQILATAIHSGFWSVWVTCFWAGLNDKDWKATLLDYAGNDYDNNDYWGLEIVTENRKGKVISKAPDLKKQLIKKLFYYGFPRLSLHFPGTKPDFLEPSSTTIVQ